jgi:hypothetical protein
MRSYFPQKLAISQMYTTTPAYLLNVIHLTQFFISYLEVCYDRFIHILFSPQPRFCAEPG